MNQDDFEGQDRFDPDNPPHGHEPIAKMNLSGTTVAVGTSQSASEDSIWLWTSDQFEPTYMNAAEAELLVASLRLAQQKVKGND